MKFDKDNTLTILIIICYLAMFCVLVAGLLSQELLYLIMAIYLLGFAIAFKSRMGGM